MLQRLPLLAFLKDRAQWRKSASATMTHTLLLDPESGSTQDAPRANLSPDLADQLDQVMQRDRDFFLQHPDRDYYVRPITPVEVLEGQALGKEVHDNARVLVGEVVPGSRIRLTILDDLPPPVEEFRAIQQQLRHEMGRRLQLSKTAFNTIKNPALKRKASELKSRGDRNFLFHIEITILFLLLSYSNDIQ